MLQKSVVVQCLLQNREIKTYFQKIFSYFIPVIMFGFCSGDPFLVGSRIYSMSVCASLSRFSNILPSDQIGVPLAETKRYVERICFIYRDCFQMPSHVDDILYKYHFLLQIYY